MRLKPTKGLLERIEGCNKINYEPITTKQLESMMKSLERLGKDRKRDKATGKFLPGWESKARDFVFYAGQGSGFMEMFDKAMKEQAVKFDDLH